MLFYLPGIAYRRAARRHFAIRFPESADRLWEATSDWQARLAPTRPRHSASVNLMMKHMEWGLAIYRALDDHGVSGAEAGPFVEAVMTDVYRPVPTVMFRLSRLRSSKRETRVRWLLLRVMTRRFFTAPFVHRYLDPDDGVAYDVTSCPFADYFEAQGLPELTPHAACNLDYRLAEVLGAELTRTQTIAGGADHCDFRWKIPA